MSGYTKAEWKIDGLTVYALEHYGWRKGEETFQNRFSVDVQGPSTTPIEERGANARLIAAAPDLFEALKELVTNNSGGDEDCGDPACDDCCFLRPARAALAKAVPEVQK